MSLIKIIDKCIVTDTGKFIARQANEHNNNSIITSPYTSLYLHGDSLPIVDATGKNAVTVFGSTTISNAIKKNSSGSLRFNGTGDYLTVPDLNFGYGDFTLETWVYLNSYPTINNALGPQLAGTPMLMGQTDATTYVDFSFGPVFNGVTFSYWTTENYTQLSREVKTTDVLSLSTWYHIAAVNASNTIKIYINGVEKVSGALQGTPRYQDTPRTFAFGSYLNMYSSPSFNGYIDDVIITKGLAKYTSNFTPV